MLTAPTSKQGKLILERLQAGERHTVATALERLRIYALSQRVGELRRAGWPILDRWLDTAGGARVKEYFIGEPHHG